MAVTSAAASASFALRSPQRLFIRSSSSKSFQTLSFLKLNRDFSFSLGKLNSHIINKDKNNRRCRFAVKVSQSSSQDSASQSNDEDGTPPYAFGLSDKEDDDEFRPFSLELLVLAYKEAILNGHTKTMSDFQAIISMVELEKNELLEKISSLSEKVCYLQEEYIHLLADFDNYRKRSEKEKLTLRSESQGKVIESFLPLVDSFERAKQHLKLETEQEKNIYASYQGIYKQLVEIMEISLLVSAVPTVGNPFEPFMQEPLAWEESQEFEKGIVMQEVRRGFVMQDRLLRPAIVKVSLGPGQSLASSVQMSEQSTTAGVDER